LNVINACLTETNGIIAVSTLVLVLSTCLTGVSNMHLAHKTMVWLIDTQSRTATLWVRPLLAIDFFPAPIRLLQRRRCFTVYRTVSDLQLDALERPYVVQDPVGHFLVWTTYSMDQQTYGISLGGGSLGTAGDDALSHQAFWNEHDAQDMLNAWNAILDTSNGTMDKEDASMMLVQHPVLPSAPNSEDLLVDEQPGAPESV
jgi:hypothetical protein